MMDECFCPTCGGSGRVSQSAALDIREAEIRTDAKARGITLFRANLVKPNDGARLTGLSVGRLRNLQSEGRLTAHRLTGGRVAYHVRELAGLGINNRAQL